MLIIFKASLATEWRGKWENGRYAGERLAGQVCLLSVPTTPPEEDLLQETSVWVALQWPEQEEAEYLSVSSASPPPSPTPSSGIPGKITQCRKIDLDVWAVGVLGRDQKMVTVKLWQCCFSMWVVKISSPLIWNILDLWLSPRSGSGDKRWCLLPAQTYLPLQLPFGGRYTRALLCCMCPF